MNHPYQRVPLALSYIKGPKVDDWVAHETNEMYYKVYGNPNANPPRQLTHHEDDEAHFEQAFADTDSAGQAYADLMRLEMKGDEIDEYNATFEHLLTKAGWELTAHGSLELFKQGLKRGMHRTILQRNPIPQTIVDWQAAAPREIPWRRLVMASLRPCGSDYLSLRQN